MWRCRTTHAIMQLDSATTRLHDGVSPLPCWSELPTSYPAFIWR